MMQSQLSDYFGTVEVCWVTGLAAAIGGLLFGAALNAWWRDRSAGKR